MAGKDSGRKIRTFSIASFLNDLGSDMINPIWPLFLTTVLNANMAMVGFIDGLGDAFVSISQAGSGYLSDRTRKRKPFIWLGYSFASLSRIGYAFSSTWQSVIPFRILDRSGKIRDAPRDAIVADISKRSNRGRNFGIIDAMDNMGAVFGIILSILLFPVLGYQNLFLLAAIPSAIGAVIIIKSIKERKRHKEKLFEGISFRDMDRNLKLFIALSGVFALGSFSYSFLLIYANEFGFETAFVPVLYLIFTAVATIFSLPFGKLSDSIGRKPVMLISYGLWAAVCLSFIFVKSYIGVILTFVLYGMHKGAIKPVQKTFVSELAPRRYKASILGGFQMAVGLCALPASVAAGFLWESVGTYIPFCFSLGLTTVSMVMMLFVREKGKGIIGIPRIPDIVRK